MAKTIKVMFVPWVGHGKIGDTIAKLGLGEDPDDLGVVKANMTRREIYSAIDLLLREGLNVMVKHWKQPPDPELFIGVDTKAFSMR